LSASSRTAAGRHGKHGVGNVGRCIRAQLVDAVGYILKVSDDIE
jgi:hypothetical protein